MEAFTALADPTRRRIVEALARGALSSGQIAERFPITRPAISQHLNVLRAAGLVRKRPDGQRRIYELERTGVDALGAWVDDIRRFWAPRLDALEAQLRKDEP